jgi:hypothetical protein
MTSDIAFYILSLLCAYFLKVSGHGVVGSDNATFIARAGYRHSDFSVILVRRDFLCSGCSQGETLCQDGKTCGYICCTDASGNFGMQN